MSSQLETLLAALHNSREVLILPHNNPDPDAIASAVALRFLIMNTLSLPCLIAYKGTIGRAENRALMRYLNDPMRRLEDLDMQQPVALAVVDTQPGTGNSPIDSHVEVRVVIDHHPRPDIAYNPVFADIRPECGATATIMTQYLQAAAIQPPPDLATALFYGIKTDTLGLVRGATADDIDAYLYLQPLVDVNKLIMIENAQVPAAYFRQLNTTVEAASIYNDLVVSYIGPMGYPDLAGEMADLLLRMEGIQSSMCLGTFANVLIFSIRTRRPGGGAGSMARAVVTSGGSAGGHGAMAGGQVPLNDHDPASIANDIIRRFLEHLNTPPDTIGMPLLDYAPLIDQNRTLFS